MRSKVKLRAITCAYCRQPVSLPLPEAVRNGCPSPCGCGAKVCGPTPDPEGTAERLRQHEPVQDVRPVFVVKRAGRKFYAVFYLVGQLLN